MYYSFSNSKRILTKKREGSKKERLEGGKEEGRE